METETAVDLLFPGNPLLCVGVNKRYAVTDNRERLRGSLGGGEFIVPSPMTARKGLTKDGKQSARTLSNVGPRRFVIVEFDSGTLNDQAALLSHLSDIAPLAAVVFSGGKSLHGWFRAYGHSDANVAAFFRSAVRLGADPATWTACQFVRMPGGRRENGAEQDIRFFNPGVLQ